MNAGEHILIIDDEDSLRHTMARILQRAGYDVTTAANGKEGLTLVSEHPFDLIYLDIRMPDISGLELLKTIHAKFPDLPVILFTAQPDLNSAVEALRRGATDYLLKPLKPQTVIDRTEIILTDRRKERRKRELQKQIDILQTELNSIENQGEDLDNSTPQPPPVSDDRFLTRGGFKLDLHTRRAIINDRVINLPPTSFEYLLVLARHAPNVVDYQTLVSEAQGYDTNPREARELTKWHIHDIRQAIEPNSLNPIFIINVRGKGYRLVIG